MPFPFRYICDLLQELDDESHKDERKQIPTRNIIEAWFREHRSRLDVFENDPSAILSTLLPERRTDRVYLIQTARLETIFGKALLLGASRLQELRRYRTPGLGVDLADCIEGILKRTPNDTQDCNEPTVEEVDDTLTCVAAACRFSSPSVRASRRAQDSRDQDQSLVTIYRRLSPRDAKWFTRLILKNYQPVVIDERLVFRCYNVLLPQLMKVRDEFITATTFLRQIKQPSYAQTAIASMLKPSIGTKVGRQTWLKGRSIKHCLDMGRSRDMSCEQKIDGEYCQIHIDLRKPYSPIQIFSKGGKDSTQDRIGLHQAIRDSLKLGTPDCPLKTGCILEGEMVVYSSKDNQILPFHKIRKHVSRSGSFIGVHYDSQPHDYEHLMIVYFDILLIEDESLLGAKQFERFKRLTDLVTCRKGYAELVPREIISFGRPSAALRLREAFAKCIVSRGEGLVLKPDEPYFNFSTAQKSFSCCNIKLKKEYVQGWGDVGDLAVVGASYDAAKAREYKRPNIKWTHFFIGCLDNREKARAGTEKPRFIVTNVVLLSEALLGTVMTQCFPSPVPFDSNQSIILDFKLGKVDKQPADIFLEPLVFDMRCFAFDKAPNTTFWSMRFPLVSKIHHDRSYLDTISFMELRELASDTTKIPELEDSQEMREWISALEKADPGGIAVDVISQQSHTTGPRAAPRPSSSGNCQGKEAQTTSIANPYEYLRSCEQPQLSSPDAVKINSKHLLLPLKPLVIEDEDNHTITNVSQKSPVHTGRKRRHASDAAVTTKSLRLSADTPSQQSQSMDNLSELSSNAPNTPKKRQPLGQIDANPSFGYHVASTENEASKVATPGPSWAQLAESPTELSLANTTSIITSNSPRETNFSERCLTHGRCTFVGEKCILANRSILLPPCISQYAWVTENLLGDHGIDNFLTDPNTWSQEPTPSFAYKWDASLKKTRKSRVRKICLVESRRVEATSSFIKSIGEAGLTKKNGEREWVGVYDWRILEDISGLESGTNKLEGMDLWRKHYVAIA
ncbi:uncharacterized protein F4812DRAFT_433657 [Daldinia caldariorum]|uniref:uncharacterized protein n=1 Tax=Daldinia caldariorum TaxID=326644 RepID=UPI00200872E0|nr:uncharacterized protein F4812DRAFT_433657 [Daldinia caldariorum]KAI1466319.1 hypothetical protein F4812DRAFT_433657 [Daldinia caldariorum]